MTHLLSRISEAHSDFSSQDHQNIKLNKNRLYEHSRLHIHYTTYDVRREQDVINLRTHSDIMLLANNDPSDRTGGHTMSSRDIYRYARVLGIFHVYEQHRATTNTSVWSEKERMEVLWVRWFKTDSNQPSGWTAARLPTISFIIDEADEADAYGFVNPQDVIRAAHIIPAFASRDITTEFPDNSTRCSVAHSHKENEEPGRENTDYERYFVNM